MARPYAIYFKKMKDDALVVDTLDNWGIVCKDFPFKLYGEAKELPSHDWKDEDGDDEYIPDVLPIAAYEFAYKGDMFTANSNIKGFLDYLTGREGDGAEFMCYDTFTRIGRQKMRFVSVSEDIFHRDQNNSEYGCDVIVFSVTFKVNDPVTDITLSK